MAFHNVRFPDDISYGSQGGPSFKVHIHSLESGHEKRVARRSQSRGYYDVAYGIKALKDLYRVLDFFQARTGALHSFRYKDFMDCTTGWGADSLRDGRATEVGGPGPAFDDEDLVQLSNTQFQLVKRYGDDTHVQVRKITKPVSGTVKIGVNGVESVSGWTVNTETGIVTFTSSQAGNDITGGCEFDVPCRFDASVDEAGLKASIDAWDNGEIPSIIVVETLDENASPDDFNFGGSLALCIEASYTLSLAARHYRIKANTSGLTVFLPDPTNLPSGGPYFFVENDGPNSFTLSGSGLSQSITAGSGAVLVLSASKVWRMM